MMEHPRIHSGTGTRSDTYILALTGRPRQTVGVSSQIGVDRRRCSVWTVLAIGFLCSWLSRYFISERVFR